jgi:hypothetical protein
VLGFFVRSHFVTLLLACAACTSVEAIGQSIYPSQILNLQNWKITLPVGSAKKASHALEIRQTDLATYRLAPWFDIAPGGEGVVFRAPVDGATTGGTKYARSELREMTDDGKKSASWSSSRGSHRMLVEQAITSTPKIKKEVVAGQIHDAEDDVIVIRLEQSNLYVNVNGKNVHTLDSHYVLGNRFTVEFVAEGGKTRVFYNGNSTPAYVLNRNYAGAYFKAGVYPQSNRKLETDFAGNYGEVVIYRLQLSHAK